MKNLQELESINIVEILLRGPWQTYNQSITSSVTNSYSPKTPSESQIEIGENTSGAEAFCDIPFLPGVGKILDVGGGQFDENKDYMATKGIELIVWDPYNRPLQHNEKVEETITSNKVKAASSMSVLNVIPEVMVRLAHISTLKAALLVDGHAYFKIWPGEGALKGSYIPNWNSSAYQANAYSDKFYYEIEMVFGKGNVKIDSAIPNLVIATKKSETITSLEEIYEIQKNAQQYAKKIEHKTETFLINYAAKSFASSNQTFFAKSMKAFLCVNRHQNDDLQNEYDKRFGLIPL